MDLDLHIHTTASDGTASPAEVVAAAVEARLDAIAITDHDTMSGIPQALAAARTESLEIIPALEVSTTRGETELHILGYFIDPEDTDLVEHTGRAGSRREERLYEMIARLHTQGVEIDPEAVKATAGGGGSIGRPHLARAMAEAGYVESVPEAFDRYIGNDHPAYVPTRLLDPGDAIRLIRKAGGIAIWAHPPVWHLDALLPELVDEGLAGLEIYRPRMPRDRVLRLERAAQAAGLLVSGGSDWHGPDGGPLGEFRVQATEVPAFLEAGGM